MPLVRPERDGAGPARLTGADVDALLRPVLEAAIAVARAGEEDTPAVPAPTALRPLLNFAKLPRRALAVTRKALDTDDEFRSRVVEAAAEEEVGRAGWLYLTRPEGWEEEMAAMVAGVQESTRVQAERQAENDARRRLAGIQEAARRAEEAAAAARAQAAEATAALAGERRARQAAAEAAEAADRRARQAAEERDRARAAANAAKTEVDALRRRIAELQSERRSAPPPAAPPPAAAPPAAPPPAAAPPAAPPVEPVERAPTPAPPAAPPPYPAAPALEQAAGAAAQLAEALRAAAAALAPPAAEPPPPPLTPVPAPRPRRRGGARRQPVPLPPAVFDDSPEAARHLLRVPAMMVIVDGYNVSQAGWPALPIAEQRERLVDALTELAARTGADARVVFDGAELAMPGIVPSTARSVKVSFSPPGVEADDIVVELVSQLPNHRPVTVVSSDRRVQRGAHEAGANVISSQQLLAVLSYPPR